MQKTLAFYNQALPSMRYGVDKEGLISITTATGQLSPAEVEGKRLVLPTKARLKEGFGDAFQAWHPLSETMARRGTSPVMQHMQRNARAQLSFTYIYLAQQLLRVAADRELHKELPPTEDCNEFLNKMQLADDKLVKIFDRLVQAASEKKRLITLYLKNGGTYAGKKVNRLAVIRFPLIELLETEDNKVLGIEIKPKQRQVLLTLLRTILPNGDDPEQYSAGSNNRVAPYFHAFMTAYRKVIVQLNKIISRYGQPMALPVKAFPMFDEEYLSQFAEIYDEIPSLEGNEGGVHEVEDEAPVVAEPAKIEVAKSAPAQGIQVVSQPGVAPVSAAPLRTQAAKVVEEDTIDFEALKQSMMPQQAAFGMGAGYPNTVVGGGIGVAQQGHVVLPWQQQAVANVAPQNPFAAVAASRTMDQNMPLSNPYGTGYGMGAGVGVSTTINAGVSYQTGMAASSLL
ncbi:hypothetical protein FDI21_gp063 [Pseudomonas phage Noxifer]|uniref:Uncharacterized protein n=1 Tax=Pseudomonas phage Noxifer TaxID=2006684 RepID=A0A1Y0SXA1_9CAUD|nr:hypothetical protein FDI21_gp063 [Pseudomonas phage Noxifer]ARV77234.1 hypothetical protein NOXIFER_63 [Pseudomonas phage Noxifer]